jgi:hypothetical protein
VIVGVPTGLQLAARRSFKASIEGVLVMGSAPLKGAFAPGVCEGHYQNGDEDKGFDKGQ